MDNRVKKLTELISSKKYKTADELAKELNVKSPRMLEILAGLGVPAKSAVGTIEEDTAALVKEFIEKDYADDEEIKIIRTKKFEVKPMYPEDACVQMELLGHNFYVFINAENNQVNVVYKRKNNTYGLIEPEA